MAVPLYVYKQRIKKITLANGSEYEFEYDGMSNITAIKINGKEAYKYAYDEDGRLVSQEYGNGDKYIFGYENGMIKTVSFKGSADTDATLKYQYAYDDKKRVESVSNGTETLNTFEYDDQNRIVKQTGANSSVEKTYDNLGNVATQNNTVDGYSVYQSYEPLRHSRYCNTKSKFGGFTGNSYVGDFSRNAKLIYKDTLLAPITHDGKEQHDIQYLKDTKGTTYVKVDKTHTLSYKPDCEHIGDMESGNVQFWFKPSNSSKKQVLFSCRGNDEKSYIEAYILNQDLILTLTDRYGNVKVPHCISNAIIYGKWNFFALDFYNRDDGLGYGAMGRYRLTLNEETVMNEGMANQILNIYLDCPTYNIGHGFENDAETNVFEGGIACLRIMPRIETSAEQEQGFYNYSKQFVEGALVPDEEIVNDVSATNVFALTPEEYNTFEVYPLQKDLLSLKGKKPVIFDCASNYRSYHSRTFEIDEDTKRYAYLASNGKLAYNFEQTANGTIMMRAKANYMSVKRQIFESKDASGVLMGLFIDTNGKLIFVENGEEIDTGLTFTKEVWHTVGVSFYEEPVLIKGSVPNDMQRVIKLNGYYRHVRVMLDDVMYSRTIHHIKMQPTGTTMIGRTFEGATVDECNAFRGHIETLATSKTFIDQNTFMSFANKLNCMSKLSSYDEFNMLMGEDVLKDGVSVYSKDITYKALDKTGYKQLSHIVAQEDIKAGGRLKQTTRQYTTDSFGRVTGITDNLFGGHTYTYDKRGFLTSADGETYEYDANGNITKMGNTVLTYDSVMKDRLVSVGGKAVSYATDSSICPTAWNGINYTFEGRRLVGYGVSLTKTNIAFAYTDRGLRTKKVVSKPNGSLVGGNTSTTTEYFYDGDKLIAEKRGTNTRLDYLYDENGSLYGFVYNKTDKYFYVRDVLQNILGIIDSNGTLVVRYKYNAWGKKVLVQDATQIGIGEINPFRFKGYYYDTETGMYYCQSRYYVPEWGRWLNGDHPYYLNPSNLVATNLFAYCANDPVNNIDPTGTWLITAILIGCALIGAGVGGYIGNKRAKEAGKTGKELVWETIKGVLLGGAVGLAAGGAFVSLCSVAAGVHTFIIGAKIATSLTFGIATVKAFAIGALAFDFTAFVVMPLIGVTMNGIELGGSSTQVPKPKEGPIPPWAKPKYGKASKSNKQTVNIHTYF